MLTGIWININDIPKEYSPRLLEIQEKYKVYNIDDLFKNRLTAEALGYTHVNINKHGADLKKEDGENTQYAEVKSRLVFEDKKNEKVTFNDTSLKKAREFQTVPNVQVVISTFKGRMDNLTSVIYGSSKQVGSLLEEKVTGAIIKGISKRPGSVSIPVQTFIKQFGFQEIKVKYGTVSL